MDQQETTKVAKPLSAGSNFKLILVGVVVVATVLGTASGFLLSKSTPDNSKNEQALRHPPKTAQQDTRTFRDFAEGVIRPKPAPSDPQEYTEGTHLLERQGAVPAALTSSVIDLSKYEGRKVKVYGETQKALKEGWLMDIGKVEQIP